MRTLFRGMTEASFRMTVVITAFAASLSFVGPRAHAQQPATPAKVETLDAIVVTASRAGTLLEDMPLHTTVVTQEDILKSPAQSLDQVLRNVPGLGISATPYYAIDPTGQNIKFRGMDKKVLVLLDGMPVLDPFYTTIQWFKLPLASVERTEVIRGGGSSLWGNLAVGGVINVVSKRPKAGDGEFSVSGGSLNTWNAAVSKNFVLSDAFSLNVSADSFRTDGYNTAPEDYRAQFWPGRGNSAATNQNLRVTAFFKPSTDINGFLRLGYHEQNEQVGGYLNGSNLQKSPDLAASLTKYFDDKANLQVNFWTQRETFKKYNGAGCYASTVFVCGAAAATAATPAQQAARTIQYASSYDDNPYNEQGASAMYSREFVGLLTSMQLGVDYRRLKGQDSQQSYATPTAASPLAFRLSRTNYGGGTQEFTGIFAQFKLAPVDALEITLSARGDSYSSFNGTATQSNYNAAGTAVTATTGGAVPDSAKRAFNPTLSARYEVNEQLAVRGSAYKAFRAPGLNNLYRSFGSSQISVANPLLGPETLQGAEVGADWRGGNYSLGATLFDVQVKDVVTTYTILARSSIPQPVLNICGATYTGVANTACPGTVAFYTNGQNQRSKGLELDGKWQASRTIGVGAYYTYTSTYYTSVTTTDPLNVQLPLVPKDVVGISLTYKPDEKWTLFADARYNGFMTLNLVSAPAVAQTQEAYTTVNMSANYSVNKNVDLFAAGQNLTNVTYTDNSASNPQGKSYASQRTFTAGLRTRF